MPGLTRHPEFGCEANMLPTGSRLKAGMTEEAGMTGNNSMGLENTEPILHS
ncbi:MAG: hypothetical protein JXA82_16380 [Sedimentisphaerales bacterium]|nr:hypothetical protein [Sedimentisphaerales bacterium]